MIILSIDEPGERSITSVSAVIRAETLGESERIQSHAERLGQEERNADGGTDVHSEAAGDDVVGATGSDPHVGGDRRQRQRRCQSDGVGDHDDHHGARKTHVADHPTGTQKQNHTKDREDRRGEHSDERSQFEVRLVLVTPSEE